MAALERVLKEIKLLKPEELRQVELALQSQLAPHDIEQPPATTADANAWMLLEELIGTVEAPADWAEEHDHYLSGAPKSRLGDSR